jgi:hypothetical protein
LFCWGGSVARRRNNKNNQDNEQMNDCTKYTDGGMANGEAIAAREVNNETTMAIITTTCSVAVVAILKTISCRGRVRQRGG